VIALNLPRARRIARFAAAAYTNAFNIMAGEALVTLGQFFVLALTVLVGIAGLFLAAAPEGGFSSGIGFSVFLAAVIYAFAFIKRHFDRIDASR